jgi:hypothetical protein
MFACMQSNVLAGGDICPCLTCEEKRHMMILFCPGGVLPGKSNGDFQLPDRLPLSSISLCDEPARRSVPSAAWLYASALP